MKNRKLSETHKGRLWLSQFKESDIETAKTLLDDLIYVTNDKFIQELNDLITNFVSKNTETIALFAARENLGEPYWKNKSKPPKKLHTTSSVGSEGMIAHLCRDIASSNQKILDHPSIEEMKDRKCKYLVFVDDMIASGTRIEKFSKWLYENKTIKSWHSLKYIKFIGCAYFASILGENRILDGNFFDQIIKVQSNGNGRSIWKKQEKERIINLCNKYAVSTNRSYWPLGFDSAFTTMLLSHKCPNTNPAILWASKPKSWNAIFDHRPELVLNPKPIQDDYYYQNKVLNALGHTKLTKPAFFQRLNKDSRQLLVLLSCIASNHRKENILSDMMELPIQVIRQKLEICKINEWINNENRISKLGKDLLASAKRNECIETPEIELKNEYYYPKTYRGSAISSS